MRGLKYAVDYLISFYPVTLVPDDIHKRAGITVEHATLQHSLRREVVKEKSPIRVIYRKSLSGVKIAHYKAYAKVKK